jgi:hypothetical protein
LCPNAFEIGIGWEGGSIGSHDSDTDVFVMFEEPFSIHDNTEMGFEEIPIGSG